MKILAVQTTDWVRKNPAQQHHLLEMLSLRGHEIRVIDFEIFWKEHKGGFYSRREIFRNICKVHGGAKVTVIRPVSIRIPLLDYVSIIFSQIREISRQVREFSPDVILSFGVIAYIAGRIARRNSIPFVYYWIDVTHRLIPFTLLQPLGWVMERRALKLADKVFVINKKLGEYVIRNGADPKKTIVLGAGVDFRMFSLKVGGTIDRKRFGFKDEDIILFFMGWLYRFSGLKEVTMQLSNSKSKNVKLLVVGDGDIYSELQQMRIKYDLQDRLILVGKIPYAEIPKFITASDICLLPAYPSEKVMQDIVPIKIYEYMAMEKPVISTRLPGVVREFGEEDGVVYVEKPEDVVSKAIELVQSGRLEEIRKKARHFVKRYGWEKITDKFEEILQDTVHVSEGI